MSNRTSTSHASHPDEWPAQSGKRRVLIENPDRADLWAHADVLREQGYEVATCLGPAAEHEPGSWRRRLHLAGSAHALTEGEEPAVCPMAEGGRCPLVDGADVVVSTTQLTDGRRILAALSARGTPPLVVEGTSSELERNSDVIGGSIEVALPVMPADLVGAVEQALSSRAAG